MRVRRRDPHEQLSFDDALWGKPEPARDEQIRQHGDAPLAADRPGPLPSDPGERARNVLHPAGGAVQSEILALADAIAGKDRPGESYLEKLGRLNQAQFDAESEILREMVLIPEPEEPEEPLPDSWGIVQRAIQEVQDEENDM